MCGHFLIGRSWAGVPAVSHANPFFYIISGFRHGFLGVTDSPLLLGALSLGAINLTLFAICYALLRSGWKIKN